MPSLKAKASVFTAHLLCSGTIIPLANLVAKERGFLLNDLCIFSHAAHLLGMATNIPLAMLVAKERVPLKRYF
jgi:hypothetical protein